MRDSPGRLAATFVLDVRRQAGGGFWLVAVLVGALTAMVLHGAGPAIAGWWPVVLLGELTITCFYFAAVQVLLERGEGTLTARAVTPLRETEYLAALAASLGVLAAGESATLVLVGGPPVRWPWLLAGVLLLSTLHVLTGVAAVVGFDSVAAFLLPSGAWTLLFAVPVLPWFGLPEGRWLWCHPLTPAIHVLRVAFGDAPESSAPTAMVAGAAWAAVGLVVAARRLRSLAVARGAPA